MASRDTLGAGIGLLRMNTTSDDVELDARIQACMHVQSVVCMQSFMWVAACMTLFVLHA